MQEQKGDKEKIPISNTQEKRDKGGGGSLKDDKGIR